ncbi:MAG: DNA polymerase III subunit beta [Clostridia bacterium]|nr:DNA polymerase III subunit beta [Clostridia bacterium]MDD4571784.1 DNA polymerase III subunit beta [Clostridia bacterium]
MEINCQKEDILMGIQTAGRAISGKNTLPILGGILIQAQNNSLNIKSTDLDIAIECSVAADVVKEGELVIADGRRFIEIVRQLPEGNINISAMNDFDLTIKYGESSLNIRGFDGEQFPLLPGREGDIHGNMAAEVFNRMVREVAIAAASDESRPIFTGILIDIQGENVIMVATDTHRLAKAEGIWQGDDQIKVVVPAKTMLEITKIAAGEENIEITISKKHICFVMGNTVFISRIINGQYPDYEPIMPKEEQYKTEVSVAKKTLLNSLSRASLLARDNNSIVKLNFTQNEIVMTADSPDVGNIKENIPANIEGEYFQTAYNVRYLIDALKVMEGENILMRLTGVITPGIILPQEEKNYTYLLLPIRLSNQ